MTTAATQAKCTGSSAKRPTTRAGRRQRAAAQPQGIVVEPTVPSPMLTTREAAVMLRLTEATLEKWRATGGGPAWQRVGARAIRYRSEDVLCWLDQQKEAPDTTTRRSAA